MECLGRETVEDWKLWYNTKGELLDSALPHPYSSKNRDEIEQLIDSQAAWGQGALPPPTLLSLPPLPPPLLPPPPQADLCRNRSSVATDLLLIPGDVAGAVKTYSPQMQFVTVKGCG